MKPLLQWSLGNVGFRFPPLNYWAGGVAVCRTSLGRKELASAEGLALDTGEVRKFCLHVSSSSLCLPATYR